MIPGYRCNFSVLLFRWLFLMFLVSNGPGAVVDAKMIAGGRVGAVWAGTRAARRNRGGYGRNFLIDPLPLTVVRPRSTSPRPTSTSPRPTSPRPRSAPHGDGTVAPAGRTTTIRPPAPSPRPGPNSRFNHVSDLSPAELLILKNQHQGEQEAEGGRAVQQNVDPPRGNSSNAKNKRGRGGIGCFLCGGKKNLPTEDDDARVLSP